jgi:predicted RNase H-like nuclease (RuvC/YqgF family)
MNNLEKLKQENTNLKQEHEALKKESARLTSLLNILNTKQYDPR